MSQEALSILVHENGYKAEVYKDGKGEFRSRIKAKNGETLFVSSESYTRKDNCEAPLEKLGFAEKK